MRLSVLLFCLLFVGVVIAQDNVTETPVPTVPDLTGLTPAQAEATLNQVGLLLDPIIVSVPATANTMNTVIDQSLTTGEPIVDGAVISITVAREANVEFVWETERYGNTVFNIRNMTGTPIYFEGVDLINPQTGDVSRIGALPNTLREQQCFQLGAQSSVPAVGYFEVLAECDFVQGGGTLALPNAQDQFWLNTDTFDIYQNGIYRDTCQVSAGSCQIWVSSTPYIAEDLTPYTYMVYDSDQFVIYNNNASQWMDLEFLQLATLSGWDSSGLWTDISVPEFTRLAPNQCVRFAISRDNAPLVECDEIAFHLADGTFWASEFDVVDLFGVADPTTCPLATGNQTLCIRSRTPNRP